MSGIHLTYVPLPPAKRAIIAAAVQPCRRRKTVRRGHRKTVLWVSSETIKTVRRPTQDSPAANTRKSGAIAGPARQSGTVIARQSVRCLARLPRQSGGLRETVRRDRRCGQRRTVWPHQVLRACRRQPSQHKPARHGRGCACGRPTPPAILHAHRSQRGRVTVDNIRSCSYPYVCYIYVQFIWAIRVFTGLGIPIYYILKAQ
jgi:hypothetical protein